MKFFALLAALMFAGVVSADNHTGGAHATDPNAKTADHGKTGDHAKDKKEEKKEAKKK